MLRKRATFGSIIVIMMLKQVSMHSVALETVKANISSSIDQEERPVETANQHKHIQNVFKSTRMRAPKAYKQVTKTLVDHISSASSAMALNDENVAIREQRADHYVDDLFAIMSSLLRQLARLQQKKESEQDDETSKVQRQHLASHRSQKLVTDSTLSACMARIKETNGQQNWLCSLNSDFNALDPRMDANFCSCTHKYECIEYEQYSLDEIDLDDHFEDQDDESELIDRCQAALNADTGQSWNCTLSWGGQGPNGENEAFCDCQTKKMCEFQKVLFINQIFSKSV